MSTMRVEKKIHGKIEELVSVKIHSRSDVQLGKKGLSKGFIEEVKNRLEKRGVVKIRILKSFIRSSGLDKELIARDVADACGAELRDMRGYTFILVKKRFKNKTTRWK